MMITYEQLKRLGACQTQIDLFKKTFGVSVTLTKQVILDHHKSFDIDWFVNNILSKSQKQAYVDARAPLWQAYKDARAPLWQAYEDARAPLWQAYEEAEAPLWQAYEEAEAPLWQAYEEAEAPLWQAYEEAKVSVLITVLGLD